MDYNLQKTISPYVPFNLKRPYLRGDQSKDFVNPGIAQASKLFCFYIPIATKNSLTFEKIGEQKGSGSELESNLNTEHSTNAKNETQETLLLNSPKSETINSTSSESTELETPEKSLDEQIKESFMHPRINVKSVTFTQAKSKNNKTNNSETKKQPKVNHKFKFLD